MRRLKHEIDLSGYEFELAVPKLADGFKRGGFIKTNFNNRSWCLMQRLDLRYLS